MPNKQAVKISFNPDGEDLQKVLYFYNLPFDDKIICPFHDDNNPSLHLDLPRGFFHCFACGASGDAFDFVSLANKDLKDIDKLITYHKIINSRKVEKLDIKKVNVVGKKQMPENRAHDFDLASDYYFGLKTIDWTNDDEIPNDLIKHKKYMIDRGFTPEALNLTKAKLTYVDDNYPLIFPIFDNDDFRGYLCRTTNPKIEKQRKYLYNKGFSRNDTIGGDYNTNNIVTICEGYMDALKLRQFGLKNAVAIFGWKITKQQINKLRKFGVETVISALDLDEPGRRGNDYLKNFFEVIEFQYPDDANVEDPGDLTREQFLDSFNKTRHIYRNRKINRRNI